MSFDHEGTVRLLAAALAGTPALPGAACRDSAELFDPPAEHEPSTAAARRHEAAVRLCRWACPVLAECERWADTLTKSQRPGGVIAGHRPRLGAPGRPRKASA